MEKNVLVLGAGLVGSAIALDLAKYYKVAAADISALALSKLENHNIRTLQMDLSDAALVTDISREYDLVIGCVPGFMGYSTLEAVIRSGTNIVDISFFPEDAFGLDALAKELGVTAVVDCGVAPGMCNILLGYHNERMKVNSYRCLVGGLPVVREWPFQYKAVFSPIDVLEEYIRPARYKQSGVEVVREALSEVELLNFPGIGTLEVFNTDGLRSLLITMPDIPDMIEKTMRYPGTIEYLSVLRDCGFFSYEETEVNGTKIRPIDLTAKLLFPKWKLAPGEEDFTVMRVEIEGDDKKYTYDLLDRYDRESHIISMARCTGYTCTAAARLVMEGKFSQAGICPPEFLGVEASHCDFILNHLAERGVEYKLNVEVAKEV